MSVWVQSNHRILGEALVLLLQREGFTADTQALKDSDVAIVDLTSISNPVPPPPPLPTVAILGRRRVDPVDLLRQRYRGIVRARDGTEVLIQAVRAVKRGEIWANRAMLTQALDAFSKPQLTQREDETLELLSEGLSNRDIAQRLGIKEGTVKMHVSRVFAKMGVRSRAELLAKLLET